MKTILKIFPFLFSIIFITFPILSCKSSASSSSGFNTHKINLDYFNNHEELFQKIKYVQNNSIVNLKRKISKMIEDQYQKLTRNKLNSQEKKDFLHDLSINVENDHNSNFNNDSDKLQFNTNYHIQLKTKFANKYFLNSNNANKDYVDLTKINFNQLKLKQKDLQFVTTDTDIISHIKTIIENQYNQVTNSNVTNIATDSLNWNLTLNKKKTQCQITIKNTNSYFLATKKPIVLSITSKPYNLKNLHLDTILAAQSVANLYNQIYNQINNQFAILNIDYTNDKNLQVKVFDDDLNYLNRNNYQILDERHSFNIEFIVFKTDKYFLATDFFLSLKLTKLNIKNVLLRKFNLSSQPILKDLAINVIKRMIKSYQTYVNSSVAIDFRTEINDSAFNWKIKNVTTSKEYSKNSWKQKLIVHDQYQISLKIIDDSNKYFQKTNFFYAIGEYKFSKVTIPLNFNFQTNLTIITYWQFYNFVYQKLMNLYNMNKSEHISNIHVLKDDVNLIVNIVDLNSGMKLNANDNQTLLKTKIMYQITISISKNDPYFAVFKKQFVTIIKKINNFDPNYFVYKNYLKYKIVNDLQQPTLDKITAFYNHFVNPEFKIHDMDLSNDKHFKIYYTYYTDPLTRLKLDETIDHSKALEIHLQILDYDPYFSSQDTILTTLFFLQKLSLSSLATFLQNNIFFGINHQLSTTQVQRQIVNFVNNSHQFDKHISWEMLEKNFSISLTTTKNPDNKIKFFSVHLQAKDSLYFQNGKWNVIIKLSAYDSNSLLEKIISSSLRDLDRNYYLKTNKIAEFKKKVIFELLANAYNQCFKTNITNLVLVNDSNLQLHVIDHQKVLSDSDCLTAKMKLEIHLAVLKPDQYFSKIQDNIIFQFILS